MKLKPLVCAAALATAAVFAHAEELTLTVPFVANSAQPGSFSAAFGLTQTVAGSFTDTITFTGGASGFVSGSLITIGFTPSQDINFTSVSINGQAFTLSSSGGADVATRALVSVTTPIVMTVSGIAGVGLTAGTPISASYAGTVNLSPVPEPETAALLLAGLGVVSLLGRRRLRD